jgi:tyrosine-protein phosphatase SIW14
MTKFVFGSLLLAKLFIGAEIPAAHVHNFGAVNQNLFRGGMPSDDGLRELKALGVNMVIDLRDDGEGRQVEKQKVEQLGIHYAHVPMRAVAAPKEAEIQQALSLILHDPSAKIFVHCWRGKDRTGTVIACYRIQHDGWDNRRALREAREYGMSSFERAMQAFILRFTPVILPTLDSPAK